MSEPKVANIRFQAYDKLCQCYQKDDQISESLHSCQEALEINMDPRILCDRAEVYIASGMFDEGLYFRLICAVSFLMLCFVC